MLIKTKVRIPVNNFLNIWNKQARGLIETPMYVVQKNDIMFMHRIDINRHINLMSHRFIRAIVLDSAVYSSNEYALIQKTTGISYRIPDLYLVDQKPEIESADDLWMRHISINNLNKGCNIKPFEFGPVSLGCRYSDDWRIKSTGEKIQGIEFSLGVIELRKEALYGVPLSECNVISMGKVYERSSSSNEDGK